VTARPDTADTDRDHDGVGAPPPDGLVSGGYDEHDSDPLVIETKDFDDLLDLLPSLVATGPLGRSFTL